MCSSKVCSIEKVLALRDTQQEGVGRIEACIPQRKDYFGRRQKDSMWTKNVKKNSDYILARKKKKKSDTEVCTEPPTTRGAWTVSLRSPRSSGSRDPATTNAGVPTIMYLTSQVLCAVMLERKSMFHRVLPIRGGSQFRTSGYCVPVTAVPATVAYDTRKERRTTMGQLLHIVGYLGCNLLHPIWCPLAQLQHISTSLDWISRLQSA